MKPPCFKSLKRRLTGFLAVLALSFAAAGPLWAADSSQSVKAGVVERGLKQPSAPLQPDRKIPLILPADKPEAELPADTGVRIQVSKFVFEGRSVLSETKIGKIAEPLLDKEVSFTDLALLCRKIEQFYKKKGYFLAQVYLPEQQVQTGEVHVRILEGRLGVLRIQGQKRTPEKFIRRFFRSTEKRGVIHYGRLLRSILLLNENSSTHASVTFAPGKESGTTDLIVEIKEDRPFNLYALFNNGGSDFVSKQREGSQAQMKGLLFPGDKTTVSGIMGSPVANLKYISGAYSALLAPCGLLADFAYNYSEFKSLRELRELGVRGKTQIFHTGLAQALWRSRELSVDAGIFFDYKQIQNFLLSQRSSADELRVLGLNLNIDYADPLRGRSSIAQVLSSGIPHIMGGLDRNDPAASRIGAGGGFVKYNVDAVRIQKLPFSSFLITKFMAQAASDVLPAAEEFSIGGIDTVRGFSQGEHLGDEGYVVNLELRIPPPLITHRQIPYLNQDVKSTVQFAAFIDNGAVFRKAAASGETRSNTITGCGMGLRFFFPHDVNLSFDWGFPVSGNSSSTSAVSEFYLKLNARAL